MVLITDTDIKAVLLNCLIKLLIMKKYLMYHLRWQAGIIISWPVLYLFGIIGITNILFKMTVVSFVGAFVFWYIDKWIFKGEKMDERKLVDVMLKVPSKWDLVLNVLKHSWLLIRHGLWWRTMKLAIQGKTYLHVQQTMDPCKKEFLALAEVYRGEAPTIDLPRMTPEKVRKIFAEDYAMGGIPNEEMIYKGEASEKFGTWLSVSNESVKVRKAGGKKKVKPSKRGDKVVAKRKSKPKK